MISQRFKSHWKIFFFDLNHHQAKVFTYLKFAINEFHSHQTTNYYTSCRLHLLPPQSKPSIVAGQGGGVTSDTSPPHHL
ncbi:hypothetical protein MtrunA17_Chr1g0156611 [Medicago truncatula]|uniref:Uncharacterized protein n=1 Tax=Medicago truncatula TaxID=3880 RepID=G7I776_MEDTR|nr:unknown [Medicago truncatula]RHN77609.1 hypothetical protein MtrunA17_Chr1g0156611 [Medicago truncatula]